MSDWNGKGLPPVGSIVEISSQGANFGIATIQWTAENVVVWRWENQADGQACAAYKHAVEIRPLSEPREKAAKELFETMILDDGSRLSWDKLHENARNDFFRAIDAGYKKLNEI